VREPKGDKGNLLNNTPATPQSTPKEKSRYHQKPSIDIAKRQQQMDTQEKIQTTSAFVLDAPPGEVRYGWTGTDRGEGARWGVLYWHVAAYRGRWRYAQQRMNGGLNANGGVDIKNLTYDEPSVVPGLTPALEQYNEQQLTLTKLPGSSESVRPSLTSLFVPLWISM
jgi:hypothetical protein